MSDLAQFDWSQVAACGLADRAEYFASLGSTNDHARQLAAGLPREERVLVVADQQTAGRGRGANRWWTGSGGLACTLLFDPATRRIERRYYAMISLAAAIAVAETAAEVMSRVDIGLHWPNDVFAAGKKLAGVLIEVLPDGRHLLGIGCNINNRLCDAPAEVAAIATSLFDLTNHIYSRGDVVLAILSRLDERLAQLACAPESVGQRADELCLQHGRHLTIRCGEIDTSGMCAGIAADGALLLDTLSGRQALYSGVLTHV